MAAEDRGAVVETASVASVYVASATLTVAIVNVVLDPTVATTYPADMFRSVSTVAPVTKIRFPTANP